MALKEKNKVPSTSVSEKKSSVPALGQPKVIKYKDIKTFEVSRSKWYRGKGGDNSSLLNKKGKMCCLGFYSIACGLKKKDILLQSAPNDLENIKHHWETFLLENYVSYYDKQVHLVNSNLTNQMIMINDDRDITDVEREKNLKRLFKEAGVKVKFVD